MSSYLSSLMWYPSWYLILTEGFNLLRNKISKASLSNKTVRLFLFHGKRGKRQEVRGNFYLPLTVSGANNFPLTVSGANNFPLTVSGANNFPLTVSIANNFPLTVSIANNLPLTVSIANTFRN